MAVQDILKLLNRSTSEEEKLFTQNDTQTEVDCSDSESDEEDEECDDAFVNIVSKIRNTSIKIRHSEVLSNKLADFCKAVEIDFLRPVLDVKTRWDNTCDMLHECHKLRPALKIVWDHCPELKKFKVDENEWVIIKKNIRLS